MRSPFDPSFDELPKTIPIFPLSGALLLPDGRLPLNIFEPRYLAMTEDAIAGPRVIGMVQPIDADTEAESPKVYPIGCSGRITAFNETDDGRYLITLSGLCRFVITGEEPLLRGYRRAHAVYDDYRADMKDIEPPEIDRGRLLDGLAQYLEAREISADWDSIRDIPADRLITSLAMMCPFDAREKQALLEAPDTATRAEILMSLLEMAVLDDAGSASVRH